MACGCKSNKEALKMKCPLCQRVSEGVNYRVVETVVKEDLKKIVLEDQYFTCTNEDCEVVFFNTEGEQIFLTADVNLSADFDEVTKKKKSCSGGCGGCGSH